MIYNTEVNVILRKNKSKLQKEILFLKKNVNAYKKERKAQWKLFKNKMKEDISKIQKSIDELTLRIKK